MCTKLYPPANKALSQQADPQSGPLYTCTVDLGTLPPAFFGARSQTKTFLEWFRYPRTQGKVIIGEGHARYRSKEGVRQQRIVS